MNTADPSIPIVGLLWGSTPESSGWETVRDAVTPLVAACRCHGTVDISVRRGPGLAASVRIAVRDSGPGYSGAELVTMASRLLAATRDEMDGGEPSTVDPANDPDGLVAAWRVCRSLEVITRRAEDSTGNRWLHRGHDTCELSAAIRHDPGTTVTLTLADEFSDLDERQLRSLLDDLRHESAGDSNGS